MKIFITIVVIAVLVTLAYQCDPPVKQVDVATWQRNLDEERDQVIQELNKMDAAIQEQLERIHLKAATADKQMKKSISNGEKRLLIEKEKVQKALLEVRSSTESTWDDVKQNVKENVTDIKIEVSRVREKMRNEIDSM